MAPRRRPSFGPSAWALAARYRLSALPVARRSQVEHARLSRLEVAWDGQRVVVARLGEFVRIFSADLREWTEAFIPVALAVGALKASELVVEGTVCVLAEDGTASFEALRAWVAGQRTGRLRLFLSDLHLLDGEDLRMRPLSERLDRLLALVGGDDPLLKVSLGLPGTLDDALAGARSLGLLGIVARTETGSAWVPVEGVDVSERSLSPPPRVTSPTKILFPRDGYTKTDIFSYYKHIAPVLLPYMARRPVVAQRWPDGIHDFTWYQHRVPPRAPDYLKAGLVDGDRRLLVENEDALLWLVNQAALTFHGWVSRLGSLDSPDFAVIDLDPGPDTTWPQLVEVASAIRALLELLEAPSVVKTSGQRGLHVLVPLASGQTLLGAHAFAHGVCQLVAALKPELVSLAMDRASRRGRLFLDVLQNFRGKTLVLPYSARAVDTAPVSMPVDWSELSAADDLRGRFTIRTVRERVEARGDPGRALLEGPRFKVGPALERLRGTR